MILSKRFSQNRPKRKNAWNMEGFDAFTFYMKHTYQAQKRHNCSHDRCSDQVLHTQYVAKAQTRNVTIFIHLHISSDRNSAKYSCGFHSGVIKFVCRPNLYVIVIMTRLICTGTLTRSRSLMSPCCKAVKGVSRKHTGNLFFYCLLTEAVRTLNKREYRPFLKS